MDKRFLLTYFSTVGMFEYSWFKTEEEMKEFGRAHIASHKVPRYFVFTDSFPMNAAGKIQKYKMREEAVARLGLSEN